MHGSRLNQLPEALVPEFFSCQSSLFAKRRLRCLLSFSRLQAEQINSKFITPTPQTKQGSGILHPLNLINKCLSQNISLQGFPQHPCSSIFIHAHLFFFVFFSFSPENNLQAGRVLEGPGDRWWVIGGIAKARHSSKLHNYTKIWLNHLLIALPLKTLCHLPWCIAGKQLNRGPRNNHFLNGRLIPEEIRVHRVICS